jgi:RHS repeat-associated protein
VLATFTTAAKEELLSSFVPWSADECICAFESQGEKPHQGVAPQNLALHQGITWSNSTTALGLRGLGLGNRSGSRCTGKERDTESGLDDFDARFYSSPFGRFMTPDWEAKPTDVPYANFGNPQSLNLYSYVQNNPTTMGDPDGHCEPCVAAVDSALTWAAETPAGQAVGNWGAQVLAGAATLLTAAAAGSGQLGTAYPMYYHGELQNSNGSSIFLSKNNDAQSADKAVPNPDGSKGAADHQQTAEEERKDIGENGRREVRVETPGGEKDSRRIDAARVENGKVTEARQVIRPNKNGTPPAREVRAANDIQKATGVQVKMVPVRPVKKPKKP